MAYSMRLEDIGLKFYMQKHKKRSAEGPKRCLVGRQTAYPGGMYQWQELEKELVKFDHAPLAP
jgi:hypothetical protein